MIQRLSLVSVHVLDQERAVKFYTEKLGMKVHTDNKDLGFRWVTVCPEGQPDVELALLAITPSPMLDEERARTLRDLVARGTFGYGAFRTDDCRRTHAELSARGVEFLGPPEERPYGIEAVFKDDSGNWFALIQER